MKRTLAVLALLTMLVLPALGQDVVSANIPFDFIVAGKTVPAGHYEFRPTEDMNKITLTNLDSKTSYATVILTRLAAEAGPKQVLVTFDVTGDKRYLEALWPVNDDGYLLATTKGLHKHQIVKAE